MRKLAFLALLFSFLICFVLNPLAGQSKSSNDQVRRVRILSFEKLEKIRKTGPKVFLDCDSCDQEFIKSDILFVNYVRDREDADIHIFITTQKTGSGGQEHTISFIGQKHFSDIQNTLMFVSKQTDTDDEVRRGLARMLKLGLVPFVIKTPIAEQITVEFEEEEEPVSLEDRWDYWVFNIGVYGNRSGQKTSNFTSLNADFSANRVTLESKLRLGISADFDESNYNFDDSTVSSSSESERFRSLYVKSLGEHWSAGVWADLTSSTYRNLKVEFVGGPALEYNIFPYSLSTRRQLRILYKIGYYYSQYREETIYDKISEQLFGESLSLTAEIKEPWGNIVVSLEGSHYFHDLSKNRVDAYGSLSVRVFKGLSFDIWGGYSHIHDQLSLPKGGATYEEVLLRRKELATNYYYNISLGFSYTFGSIFSNIVNPRFGR